MLVVPPGASRASDDWASWVNGVNGVNRVNWSNRVDNAFAAVPNFSSLTGDASHSIIIRIGRAAGDTLVFMVDMISNALSTFSSVEGKFSPAEIVEVGGSVGDGSLVVHGD